MLPSDDNRTELLAWHPGPGDSVQPGVLRALQWGLRRASRATTLVAALWLLDLLVVQRAAPLLLTPLRSWAAWKSSGLPLAAALHARLDLATPPGLQDGGGALLRAAVAPLWTPSPFFVLFYGVLAGALIAFLRSPRAAPLMAQLGAGCGVYAGRFLRLLLIAAVGGWAILGLGGLLRWAGSSIAEVVALYVATALLGMTIDYARVRTVARDSRSMLIETWRTGGFVLGSLHRIVALQLLLMGIALLLAAGAGLLARGVGPQGWGAFVAAQLWVAATLWLHLARWAAMLALYQGITAERLARR